MVRQAYVLTRTGGFTFREAIALPDEVRVGLMIAAVETDPNLNQVFDWMSLSFTERPSK